MSDKWLMILVGGIALFVFVTITMMCSSMICYSAETSSLPLTEQYLETVVYRSDYIFIHGSINEAQRKENYKHYVERNEKYRKQVEAEIKRKHQLDVEVAKFKNAVLLESSGAPKIWVSSWSSNYTKSQNQAINGDRNHSNQNNDRI